MFAFALWDAGRESINLVRDRIGIKPLSPRRALPGMFLFSSHALGFPRTRGFPPRGRPGPDLQYFLEFQYVPAPFSIYRNVEKVLPGHIVEIAADGTVAQRVYWDLFDHWRRAEGPARNEGEYEEELAALLDSSIRYRLISDVPLGAFLSGGIDSSLTVALMRKAATGKVKTFSIGFRESGYDESPHARAVAEHLGTEHHEKICTPEEALALVRRIPDAYDEPFADSSAIPTMLVSEFTRGHVTVSLSGDGGDELFCGYPRYAWVRQGSRALAIPGFLRRPLCSLLSRVPVHKVQRGAESILHDDAAEMYFHTVGIFERRRLGRSFRRPSTTGGCGISGPSGTRAREHRRAGDGHRHPDVPCRRHPYEGRPRLHGVLAGSAGPAARPPDRGVRGAAPHRVQGAGRRDEAAPSEGLYRHVPREILERPKMGFGIPVNRWLRNELRPLLDEYLNPDRVRREGFLRPEGVGRVVSEHLSGRRDNQYRLWALLVFAMWSERYRPAG
jgi:asparagine synthase (glutamine-hydrolysing)